MHNLWTSPGFARWRWTKSLATRPRRFLRSRNLRPPVFRCPKSGRWKRQSKSEQRSGGPSLPNVRGDPFPGLTPYSAYVLMPQHRIEQHPQNADSCGIGDKNITKTSGSLGFELILLFGVPRVGWDALQRAWNPQSESHPFPMDCQSGLSSLPALPIPPGLRVPWRFFLQEGMYWDPSTFMRIRIQSFRIWAPALTQRFLVLM